MLKELYPEDATSRRRLPRPDTAGFLRIAEEFEAVFGRATLNSFICSKLPQSGYRAGQLHYKLLSLPWAEVFTTNWDTLLEDCVATRMPNRYNVLADPQDVREVQRPRIVKVHGCVVRNRNFVVTEEDYRLYGIKNRALLYLARQSMLENATCLIGFSGEDPNFLSWSGLRRDILGEHAPPVYLVGLLHLTAGRIKLLANLKVNPIDLADEFDPERTGSPERHREAMHWFFSQLAAGEPYNPLNWPKAPAPIRVRSETRSLPTPPRPLRENFDPKAMRLPDASDTSAIGAVTQTWRINRLCYPGWLIAPHANRREVLQNTRRWIKCATKTELPNLLRRVDPDPELVAFLCELVWRIELCLGAPPAHVLELIDPLLAREDQSPGSWIEQRWNALRLHEAGAGHETSDLSKLFCALGLARLRAFRRGFQAHAFEQLHARMSSVSTTTFAEVRAALDDEWDRFLLARGRWAELRKGLDRPALLNVDPYWGIRRAGVFAEIGELEAASRIVEGALIEIRNLEQMDRLDLAMMSRRGWGLEVKQLIRDAQRASRSAYGKRYTPADTDEEAIDPVSASELDPAASHVHAERYWLQTMRSVMAAGANLDEPPLKDSPHPSSVTSMMSERTGIPAVHGVRPALTQASCLLVEEDPLSALYELMRGGIDAFVAPDSPFNERHHASFGRLKRADLNAALDWLAVGSKHLLREAAEIGVQRRRVWCEQASVYARLLSILLPLGGFDHVKAAMDLVLLLYRSTVLLKEDLSLRAATYALIRSIYAHIGEEDARAHVACYVDFACALADLPAHGLGQERIDDWLEPSLDFPLESVRRLGPAIAPAGLGLTVQRLAREARRGDYLTRNGALRRLRMLIFLGLHKPEEKINGRDYAGSLEDALEDVELPNEVAIGRFPYWSWLSLKIEPSAGRPFKTPRLDALEQRFLNDLVREKEGADPRLSEHQLENLARALTRFDRLEGWRPPCVLSDVDANALGRRLRATFLGADATAFAAKPSLRVKEHVAWILSDGVLPYASSEDLDDLLDFALDLHTRDFPVDRAFTAIVRRARYVEAIADRLSASLNSAFPTVRIRGVIEAILEWLRESRRNKEEEGDQVIPPPPDSLMHDLVAVLAHADLTVVLSALDALLEWVRQDTLKQREFGLLRQVERLGDRIQEAQRRGAADAREISKTRDRALELLAQVNPTQAANVKFKDAVETQLRQCDGA
jgi:hypothetical protein